MIKRGSPEVIIKEIVATYGVSHVYWNRVYEPESIKRDTNLKATLIEEDLPVKSFNGLLTIEPWDNQKKDNTGYKVYTAFWNCFAKKNIEFPKFKTIREINSPKIWGSLKIDELELLPKIDWDKGFYSKWEPGEKAAQRNFQNFLKTNIEDYNTQRDIPSVQGTSLLSPHLHFGEISPQYMWQQLVLKFGPLKSWQNENISRFAKEILWRDFSYNILFHFPETLEKPLQEKFKKFPWKKSKKRLTAWQKGLTGYPIVDAGMRELWATGWMHNRVRMIVGSFLTKDLMLHWREGAKWFEDTLVDADLASNTFGWQWVSGCGVDAAPYFRIFNPELQSKRFDPQGEYIKKWIPELASLPTKWIHCPEDAPGNVLEEADITLGKTYPKPIVNHAMAKIDALTAFKSIQ